MSNTTNVLPYIKLDLMCHTKESQQLEDCGAEYQEILDVSITRQCNINIFSIANWFPHNLDHLTILTLNCGTVNVIMMDYKTITEIIHEKYRAVQAQINNKADHTELIDGLKFILSIVDFGDNYNNIQKAIDVILKQHYATTKK